MSLDVPGPGRLAVALLALAAAAVVRFALLDRTPSPARAATVPGAVGIVNALVEHLPARISKAPEKLGELSPLANAVRAGYLIAQRAYYRVSRVGKVIYATRSGKTTALTGRALAAIEREYTYAAGRIG